MDVSEFFDILDVNKDGELSRSDLHEAARRHEWHWPEAPIFAVLDLLVIVKPLSRKTFISCWSRIVEDPLGPYGGVLLNAPHFSLPAASKCDSRTKHACAGIPDAPQNRHGAAPDDVIGDDGGASLLEQTAGVDAANDYKRLLGCFAPSRISMDEAALLIIDPQKSFTGGAWMQSIGSGGHADVTLIRRAFKTFSLQLKEKGRRVETMFTRCPFPPDSYGWDDSLVELIDDSQLYFIKPGNSVLFPPANGFREWVERCIDSGKNVLVMGGCTLNSCVRVSSIETQKQFGDRKLQVVVDLDLSAARVKNYKKSPMHGGLSAVESAVREMEASGVRVVRRVKWA